MQNVRLSPLLRENLEKYREWRNDPAVSDWCRQTDFISQFGQEKWFEKVMQDGSVKTYEIRDEYTCVGVCGFTSITPVHNTAEFSIYISRELQRNGYGEAALRKLISHGFNDLNFNRIWGESFEGNPATGLYEKLGFTKEGTLREAYYKNGKYINSSIWSLLKYERQYL